MMPMTYLSDRFLGWRDRVIADPAWRRLISSFPLTRPIARRKARQLFDVCAGFVYTQVLAACVRLALFDHVADHPQTLPDLAARVGLTEDATRRLVDAAVSLGLLGWRGGERVGLGELGAAIAGDEGLRALIEHHALLYADLADPVALLRGEIGETRLSRYWAYARAADPATLDAESVATYSRLMSQSQSLIASEVLDAYRLCRHTHLLDVGGGEGTFCIAAATRCSALRVTLFDLPPVAARAQARFADKGFEGRATAVGGSFFDAPLPRGADVASLVRVIYDHDDAAAMAVLRAVYGALPAEGTLLLAEPMAGTPGAEPIGDAYFGFYLLAMQSGRARTPAVLRAMLADAGFRSSRVLRTRLPLQTRLIVARR
jgi:demethylspheroidene O-methyltransferase